MKTEQKIISYSGEEFIWNRLRDMLETGFVVVHMIERHRINNDGEIILILEKQLQGNK